MRKIMATFLTIGIILCTTCLAWQEPTSNLDPMNKTKFLYRESNGAQETRIAFSYNASVRSESQFVRLHPSIDSVWYFDFNTQKIHFYAAILGGVGEDFVLYGGHEYYVVVREDTAITIP